MKRLTIPIAFCLVLIIIPTQKSHGLITEVIRKAVVKAIKAIDLQVQRLQNKTIWLQNAQKSLENTMSKLQLDEIAGWVDKNREQYAMYFDELRRVKSAITGFQQVKSIMRKQLLIVDEYKKHSRLFKQDKNFNPSEIDYMTKVYTGMVNQSLRNIDQLLMVIKDFRTSMSDGSRLQIISKVEAEIDQNLDDLRQFNSENIKLSLQRARSRQEVEVLKGLYDFK